MGLKHTIKNFHMKKSTKICLVVSAIFVVIIVATAVGLVYVHQRQRNSILRVILDTDIGPWPDDTAALAFLHSYADYDKIEIMAVMANNAYEGIVPVIDAMNTYFNRTKIPIGITKDIDAIRDKGVLGWPQYVMDNFPHPNYQRNSQAPDAVLLYRRLLAAADDYSITILSIGYFNNLANLLDTTGDEYSDLNGKDLVELKVKGMVAMAGHYPSGIEDNILDKTEEARKALLNWPTPVTFSGFEIGSNIHCGSNLVDSKTNNTLLPKSPVGMMFQMAFQYDGVLFTDSCFDPVAALVAVRGISPFFENVPGMIAIDTNGTNWWVTDDIEDATQSYVRQIVDSKRVTDAINPFIYR